MRILSLIFFTSIHAQALQLKGVANSLDKNEFVYSELHDIVTDEKGFNKKIQTKYYDSEGILFAEMTSDFSKNLTIPEIKFLDKRFKKTEELFLSEDGKEVIFKTQDNISKEILKKFTISKNMAAGQGFDNFVKIHFDQMQKKTVPLNFGVLSEMNFFSFKAYQRSSEKNDLIQFGIELSSVFLRLFSNELVLDYYPQTKQIKSYKGLSNILTKEGKTQSVRIQYEILKEAIK